MFAPIATRASAFSVAPIKPRQPNVEALQYLAATASLALETEEVLKDDLDRVFTPVAGAPAVRHWRPKTTVAIVPNVLQCRNGKLWRSQQAILLQDFMQQLD